MHLINLLIKPASGLCNLRCRYCFYYDEMKNRSQQSFGLMNFETIENIISKTLFFTEKECTIAYQGGEPTLAGLDFFRKTIEFQNKYNTKNITIHNAIQTNGFIIDEEWAKFFKENNFLVGISLDGLKKTHDTNRITPDGSGSFQRIMNNIDILKKYKVDFNILTVVNRMTAENIERIYAFYKKCGFDYQQYIACMNPFGEELMLHDYSMSAKMYGEFLNRLFDLWYEDLQKGEQPYIREFENYVQIAAGYPPEACSMRGSCGIQYVVESDGGVYPCDFYVLDEMKLGNLNTDSFDELDKKRREIRFIEESVQLPDECKNCEYLKMCRNGCRRNRYDNKNCYCESYKTFFSHTSEKFQDIADVCTGKKQRN